MHLRRFFIVKFSSTIGDVNNFFLIRNFEYENLWLNSKIQIHTKQITHTDTHNRLHMHNTHNTTHLSYTYTKQITHTHIKSHIHIQNQLDIHTLTHFTSTHNKLHLQQNIHTNFLQVTYTHNKLHTHTQQVTYTLTHQVTYIHNKLRIHIHKYTLNEYELNNK